jgi:hypothetical protein
MMRRALLLACTLSLTGCGYFNALYNAQRRFDAAQRAASRGEDAVARRAYTESIEKAANSYRRYPNGRWADDALLLITRARFALEQDREAAAAAAHVLAVSSDQDVRTAAHAQRGAALFRLGAIDSAQLHLDSAVVHAAGDDEAFARLWRARVAFRQGRTADGWADLARAGTSDELLFETSLDAATHAAEVRDSARLTQAMEQLADARFNGRSAEAIIALLDRTVALWSPAAALHASASFDDAAWGEEIVDNVALARARIAAAAGDSATALDLALRVAQDVSGGIGSIARLLAARIRLARIDDPDELEDVRALLLPAFDEPAALNLMRHIRATQILLAQATGGSALSLFAAAEHARDELAAPRVARGLFLQFAQRNADTEWAGKAVLAAHSLSPDAESSAALERARKNIYVRAAHGEPDADITAAEQRLARGLTGIRTEALALAVQQDAVVGRAVTLLDSARSSARMDSVRIVCGTFIDSLSLKGIRADSVRSACLRGDSTRVKWVLKVDTTALRDTVAPIALHLRRDMRTR